jgi:hypothetical protein
MIVRRLDRGENSGNKEMLQDAIAVTETGIGFLRALLTQSTDVMGLKEEKRFREVKARLSFRAHVACAGLGDVDKAIGFLEEAKRCESQSAGLFDAKIDALRDESGEASRCDGKREVMLWESV